MSALLLLLLLLPRSISQWPCCCRLLLPAAAAVLFYVCPAGVKHFDVSYDAFEQLAHPAAAFAAHLINIYCSATVTDSCK
jgi:hypothetical protein